jgi:hypothetical protein
LFEKETNVSIISELSAAVKNAIPALRDTAHTLAALRKRLAEVDSETAALDRLPHHPDDLIEHYTKASSEDKFLEHLRAHFINQQTIAAMASSTLANHAGSHLTAIGPAVPSFGTLAMAPADSIAPQLSTAFALEAILGQLYRDRVAELVRKALPPGYVGVSMAERAARTAKLNKERAKIVEQIGELESSLAELGIVAAAPTTAGSDAVHSASRERAQANVAAEVAEYERDVARVQP